MQQLGFGLAVAILIDITLVRGLLLPVDDGARRPLELVPPALGGARAPDPLAAFEACVFEVHPGQEAGRMRGSLAA